MTRLPRTARPIREAEPLRTSLHAVVPVAHRRDFEWLLALPLTERTRGHPYSDVGPEPWPEDELYDERSAVPYEGLAF